MSQLGYENSGVGEGRSGLTSMLNPHPVKCWKKHKGRGLNRPAEWTQQYYVMVGNIVELNLSQLHTVEKASAPLSSTLTPQGHPIITSLALKFVLITCFSAKVPLLKAANLKR